MIPAGADALPSEFAAALARVRGNLAPLGGRVIFFNRTGSTNDVAASLATAGGAEGAIVIADEQTAGRGRRGRAWFSPAGSGLYVSIVLAPSRARCDPQRATLLVTLAAGVALSEAIEAQTGLRPDIKWPNDLLIGRRKLSGILAEGIAAARPHGRPPDSIADLAAAVVLGFGINVGPMAYPPELSDRATSLETELGRAIDRGALCVETLAAVARRYRDLLDGRFDAILDAWRERAPGSRGARVTWQAPDGSRSGTTDGIDDRGALLVRSGDTVERIVSGELTWA